jgi:hypothetical protein
MKKTGFGRFFYACDKGLLSVLNELHFVDGSSAGRLRAKPYNWRAWGGPGLKP